MKIAIFHNFLDHIGGAERVSLIMARELGADIYTTKADRNKIQELGFDVPIYEIGSVPTNAPFRQQLAQLGFHFLNVQGNYDVYIIAGDWALAGVTHHSPTIWYSHTPQRELWDLKDYTKKHAVAWWGKALFEWWVHYNRWLYTNYARKTNLIVCSSVNAQRRMKKYLNVNSSVITPPVDTSTYYYAKPRGYWLSVNRLITHKQVHMQLEAFRRMPQKKLVVVGSYEPSRQFVAYTQYLKKIKPPNVELIHWVDEKRLRQLYAECVGFLTTAKDEDFGLTAVEALASGKPVIAPREGGYQETIISGKTGILITKITAEKLVTTVKEIEQNPEHYKTACITRAKLYDTQIFKKKFIRMLKEVTVI